MRLFARQKQQRFVIAGENEPSLRTASSVRTHFSPATNSGHISFFALGLYRACVRAPTLIQLSFIVMCAAAGEPFSIIRHTIGILLSHAMVYYYYVFFSFQRHFLLILSNWIRQNLFLYRVQHKCVFRWGVTNVLCACECFLCGCELNVFSIGEIRLYRRNPPELWSRARWRMDWADVVNRFAEMFTFVHWIPWPMVDNFGVVQQQCQLVVCNHENIITQFELFPLGACFLLDDNWIRKKN